MTEPKDFPIEDCAEVLEKLQSLNPSAVFHQKWTCSNCHARQTMAEPNKLFTRGICEECGAETDIKKSGCNYLLLL